MFTGRCAVGTVDDALDFRSMAIMLASDKKFYIRQSRPQRITGALRLLKVLIAEIKGLLSIAKSISVSARSFSIEFRCEIPKLDGYEQALKCTN